MKIRTVVVPLVVFVAGVAIGSSGTRSGMEEELAQAQAAASATPTPTLTPTPSPSPTTVEPTPSPSVQVVTRTEGPGSCLKAIADARDIIEAAADLTGFIGDHLGHDTEIWTVIAEEDWATLLVGPANLEKFNEDFAAVGKRLAANGFSAQATKCEAAAQD